MRKAKSQTSEAGGNKNSWQRCLNNVSVFELLVHLQFFIFTLRITAGDLLAVAAEDAEWALSNVCVGGRRPSGGLRCLVPAN